MIELRFHTADGPILIQLCAPVPTPESKWPWAVEVRTNGRPQTLVGEDPLEALETALHFVAAYLGGRDGLDPVLRQPVPPDAKGAAIFLRELAGGKVKDDGGTITPLLLPP